MQWKIRGMMAGVALLAVSLATVDAQQPVPQQPQQPRQPQLQQPPQMQQPQESVVATVNDEPITEPELRANLQPRLQGQQVDPQAAQQLRRQTLDLLIQSRLVEQFLEENGPQVTDEEIEQQVQQVEEQLEAQEIPLQQFLASRGYTEESFQDRIKGTLQWQKYQQQQATEDNLREFFEQNQDQIPGESFEEAQQHVVHAFSASLWEDIIRQTQPEAEIEILDPSLAPPSRPQQPQGLQQQQPRQPQQREQPSQPQRIPQQ